MPTPITHTSRLAMARNLPAARVVRQEAIPRLRPDHHGERTRRRRGIAEPLQLQLPPADVVPASVLEARLGCDADVPEAEPLVQLDARRVRQGDDPDRGAKPLQAERVEEHAVERAADTGAVGRRVDVDRDLDGPLVRSARMEPGGVGIADDPTLALADEPR